MCMQNGIQTRDSGTLEMHWVKMNEEALCGLQLAGAQADWSWFFLCRTGFLAVHSIRWIVSLLTADAIQTGKARTQIPWLQRRHYNHNDHWWIIVETNTVFKYNLFSTLMAGETGKQAYLLKEIESHGAGIIFPEQNGDRSVWTAFERYERGIVASTVLFCLYMTRLSAPLDG